MNTTFPLNQVRRFGWLNSCCTIVLFLAGFQRVTTHAQTTLYNYTNATNGAPAFVEAGIETMGTIEDLKRGGGVDTTINCSANQGFGSDGWPTTNTFDVDAFNASGDYIEFTLDPQAGYALYLTGFTANSRRENPSGTANDGPASLRYAYSKTGAPGSWTFVDPGNPQASSTCGSLGVQRIWTSFPAVSVSGSETITFRIYGLSSGANMTGDLFLRNIVVSGFVCNATPSASLTPVSLCEGTSTYSIPVASSSSDITSYSLSFSPAGIPTVSGTLSSPGALPSVLNISTAMAADGAYSGTLTLTNSCGVSTDIVFNSLVVINPLPVFNIFISEESGIADNDGIICPGDEVTLSDNSGSGLDQEQNDYSACMATFSQVDLAQSFKPSANTLCGAGIYFLTGGSGTVTIQLYDNLPNNGGMLLAQGSAPGSSNWVDVSWPSVSVTPGNTYYLVLTGTNTSDCLGGSTTNNYANGQTYANGGFLPYPDYDFTFHTYSCSGFDSYLWSTSETTSSITVSPGATTTYTLTVTDLGCQQTASQTITVTDPETVNAGPDQSTCVDGTVLLAGSFGGTATGASWSDNGAGGTFLPNATTLNAFYIPPSGNSSPITLTLTTDGPCPVSDDVVISYDAEPAMTLSATASSAAGTCGDEITVTVKVTEGFNDLSSLQYNLGWNPSAFNLLNSTATTIGGVTPSVFSSSGGFSYSWAAINPFGEDLPDGSVLLTLNFEVLNAGGTESIDIVGTMSTPIEATTWQQCILDVALLNDADIELTPVTSGISMSDNDGAICIGDAVTLTVSGSGTYLWSTSATTSTITVSPGSTTTYSVTVTNSNGCSASTSQMITVNSLPLAEITPSDITICYGSDVTLMSASGASYLWSTSETTGAILVSPTATTTYTVTLTDNNGCTNTATSVVSVTPEPLAGVTVSPAVICAGSTTTMTANGGAPDATYTWYDAPTGGNQVGTGNPFTTDPLVATTTYCVEQTVNISGSVPTTLTFNYTGSMQTFTVPDGVTSINIQAFGAQGGDGSGGTGGATGGAGGKGGMVQGDLAVTPGQVINLFIGGAGATPAGGYNGGANGGTQNSGGGGGATDIRVGGTADANRVLTAGGGGGGGRGGCEESNQMGGNGGNGGIGGGGIGGNGNDTPTSGGFAGGGKGGNFAGVQGALGAAGIGCSGFLGDPGLSTSTSMGAVGGGGETCCCFNGGTTPGGGGGGGGQIGGGGGGGGSAGTTGCSGNSKGAGGGGGGGSSYTGGVDNAVVMDGINTGNGYIIISYGLTPCTSPRVCGTVTVTPLPTASISVSETSGAMNDDGNICSGASVTLTATGGGTYLWSTTATTASITVSPSSTTTYTVTVTANDCSTSTSSVINVTPMPSLSATLNGVTVSNNNDGSDDTGSFAICNGSNITFDAFTDVAGASGTIKAYQTVSLSNVSLSYCNNCAALVTVFPGVSGAATLVNPAMPGTVTLSFRVFNDLNNNNIIDADECPNDWVVYTITVNPIPVPAIAVTENSGTTNNDGTICTGASVTLTASGGGTYLWSPGGATTASITINPTSNTTYTVTVTANNCSSSTSQVILVNPLPAVSLNLDVDAACLSDAPLALSGGAPVGGVYSGPGISTSPTFNPASAGTGNHVITYTYSDGNGCVNTATDGFTVYNLQITNYNPGNSSTAGTRTVCDGDSPVFTVDFATTPAGTVTRNWQYNDGVNGWLPIPAGPQYSVLLGANPGSTRLRVNNAPNTLNGYQYRVVLSNGACSLTSNAFTLFVNGPLTITGPSSVTVCAPPAVQTATFTAVVSSPSGPAPDLRWQYFNGSTWQNIANTFGGNTNPLTLTNAWPFWPTPGNSVQIRLRADVPGCGNVFSDPVTLTVQPAITPVISGPLYVNSMASVFMLADPGVVAPATLAGGTWAISGGPGTASNDYSDDFLLVATGDLPGTVTITYQATDNAGCTGTDEVTLTVLDKLTLSAIPSDLTVSCGDEITVNIEADNLVDLIELAYNLSWDPAQLAYAGSSAPSLGGSAPVIDASNANIGLLSYYWGGEYTGMPLNDHVLLTLTFTVIQNSGSAAILIDSPAATNTSISAVPINTNDGTMSVTPILILLDNPDPVCPVDCDDAQGQSVVFGIEATGNPNEYSIDWNSAANMAGIPDVLPSLLDISNGQFEVSIPCGLLAGVYGGTLYVTNTLTGCSGSTSIAVVIDNIPPQIECPEDVMTSCDIPPVDLDAAMVSDNCGDVTVTSSESNNEGYGCFGNPLIISRSYIATDAAGNSTNCIQLITLVDQTGPVLAEDALEFNDYCFDDETEALTAIRDYLLEFVTDECHPNGIVIQDIEDFNISYDENTCTATVTAGAIDGCVPANSSDFVFEGILIDGTPPTLTLTDIDDCYETIADALAAAVNPEFTTAEDNIICNEPTVEAELASNTDLCEAIIIVTATDECGNITTGTYGPVRIDGESPLILNNNPLLLSTTCFETFEEAAAAAEAAIEAGDNCSDAADLIIGTDELSPDASCPYTLTVRVTDECGNFALYQFTNVKIDADGPVPVYDEPQGPLCFRNESDATDYLLQLVGWEDECGFPVMYETATYSDLNDPDPNDDCGFGTVTVTAVDLCNHSTSVVFDIKLDATPPGTIDPEGLPSLTYGCIGDAILDLEGVQMQLQDNCPGTIDVTYEGQELAYLNTCVFIRSYTATDACGLTSTITQRIEINDDEPPVWDAQNTTEELFISCSAGDDEISLEDLVQSALNIDPPAVSDNCEGSDENVVYITVTDETFPPVVDEDCPNGYSITRTWTAVDQCGNASTFTRIVHVTDTEAPTVVPDCQFEPLNLYTSQGFECPAEPSISLYVGQELTLNSTWTVAGLSIPPLEGCIQDNCSASEDISLLVADIDYGVDDEGLPCTRTLTVTFSLIDACGNTQPDPLVLIFNIIDNSAPVWETAQNALDRVVDCNISAELDDALELEPVPVDNCGNGAILSSPSYVETPGDCAGEYTITRTWFAYDQCGNSNSTIFTQTIHVIDLDPPVWSSAPNAGNATVSCSNAGDLATAQAFVPVASDACGSTTTITKVPGTFVPSNNCPQSGTITNTFTVVDACGNQGTTTYTQVITIIDNTPPVCSTGVIASCYQSVAEAEAAAIAATTATDNCSPTNLLTKTASTLGTCNAVVTVTVTDQCGNSSSVPYSTRIDNEPPTLIANCAALAPSYPTATAAQVAMQNVTSYQDNCPGSYTVSGNTVGTCNAIVTLTYTDACGNSSNVSCSTSITATPLAIACPANASVSTNANVCTFTVPANSYNPTITGGCQPYTLSYSANNGASPASGSSLDGAVLNKGVTTITWTVTDANNASTSCAFTVTVNDTQLPTITCPANIVKSNDNNACGAVATYTVTASDNCMYTVTQTAGLPSGSTFPVGTTVNAFQAVDMSGNSAFCSFNVTVNDTQAPAIVCPANITTGNTAGQCSAVVNYSVTATDNCGGTTTLTLVNGPASGSTFPIGTTGPIQWRATDGAGNTANCSFNVTVNDTQAPAIVCPANITTPAMGGGCSATVTYIVTASDNCGGTITPVLVSGGASGSSFSGTSTVTWKATDAAMNMTTCAFTVTVTDGQNPTINCPVSGTVIRPTNVNNCFYTVVGNEFNATGADNCGTPTVTYSLSGATTGTGTSLAGVQLNKGTNTVTWTATDAGNNTAVCSFVVQVNDTRPPVVACPPSQSVNASANACGATVNPGTLGATDNCGIALSSFGPIPVNNFFPIGTTTLTGTASDNSGNTAMCTTTITVTDNQPPVFTKCPADLTLNNVEGGCTGQYGSTEAPEVSDNCAFSLNWVLSGATTGSGSGPIPANTVFNSGVTTVTFTATDASNNTAVCSYHVSVICIKVAGKIIWEHNRVSNPIGVKNATVTLMSTSVPPMPANPLTTLTDNSGMYMFNMPIGKDLMIEPTKPALNNAQKLDGVTIADAQAIQAHLNNTTPITDPYKLIAADVNSTNTVTTVDASIITSALMGNPLSLAAFDPSWKFINAATVLPNPPASPFALYNANKKITIAGTVTTDQLNKDFIGIKSGNVNGSPAPVYAPVSPLIWMVQDQTIQANETVEVVFTAVQFNDVAAYQFGLDFDPTQLQFMDIQSLGAIPSLSTTDNFGAFNAENGELRSAWSNATGLNLSIGTPVFKVRFKALTSGAKLSDLLQLSDDILPGKVFNPALAESSVVLSFSDLSTSTSVTPLQARLQLLQNRPNPFNEETTIGFVLPEDCEATLRVYDLSGREITSHKRFYQAGYHEVMFRVTNASDYGVMFYELSTPSGRLVRKMIATGK